MFRAAWYCDICGNKVMERKDITNISSVHAEDAKHFIWELPLDIDDCIYKIVVCDDCKNSFLHLDPKSPEATSRPSD